MYDDYLALVKKPCQTLSLIKFPQSFPFNFSSRIGQVLFASLLYDFQERLAYQETANMRFVTFYFDKKSFCKQE